MNPEYSQNIIKYITENSKEFEALGYSIDKSDSVVYMDTICGN